MKLLEELRAATGPLHAHIERSFASLMSPSPSLAEYRGFLEVMSAFHEALEPAVERVAGWDALSPPIERARRARRHLAESDLRALGAERTLRFEPPPLRDLGDALGAAYVLDGSALGGRVLHRHLARALPDADAFAFVQGHGESTVVMWRELIEAATAYATTPQRRERVVGSAVATFEVLARHLAA